MKTQINFFIKVTFIAIFLSSLLFSPIAKAAGPTDVSGVIFSDTTWQLSNSPYNVVGNVQIPSGVTLTIESGVLIQFTGAYQILVKGTVIANGTSDAPIVFTSSTPGVSSGATMLKFEGTNLSNSNLSHLQMSYAAKAIMVGGGGGEFNPGQPCTGTLTVSQVEINNAEIRTGGYTTTARLVLDSATISSSTVIGQYPRSEPIEIKNSNISNSTIWSDSYNYGIILDNTTANNNHFRLGCCGANFDLRNSTITNSDVIEGGGSPVAGPVSISNSKLISTSINLPLANFTINNSVFAFNSSPGLKFGNGTVTNSSFSDNGNGVGMELTGYSGYNVGGSIIISNTTFTDNIVGLKLTNANSVTIQKNNNFLRNTTYNIENRTSKPIAATENYWGTTNPVQIAAKIFDFYDDINFGAVDTSNYTSSPSIISPVSRPDGVQIGSIGDNVTVTWSANPESDVVGYKVYYDTDAGYPYTNVIDVGNVTSATLSGLSPIVQYIAVTAYDSSADGTSDWTDGNESWFSNELTADLTPPTVQYSEATYSINESVTTATITTTLNKEYSRTVIVSYATSDGTAVAGNDYTATSGTLSFAPGVISQTFDIPITDDTLDENSETILLALSNPSNATLGSPSSATLTIGDDDSPPLVSFSAASYSVNENGGSATVTINLSTASGLTVTVDYATSNGTAVAGDDYTATSGTFSFAPGVTSQTFTVPITNDTLDENSETVLLALSNPSNATLGSPSSATLTIGDDDSPPLVSFSATSYSVSENGGSATVTINLSTASGLTVTVDYATSNGTAVAGDDYTATSGTFSFAPGVTSQTFDIPIINDTLDENTETVLLALSNPSNATLGSPSSATLTIGGDDDSPPLVSFSATSYSVNENDGNATVTINLSTASGLAVAVDYSTNDGTAVAGNDYTAASGTLSFAPNETSKTIIVSIMDDTLDEVDETLTLTLSNPTNVILGNPANNTLTILDNDGPEVAFSTSSHSVNEGGGSALISVNLSATSVQTITVAYATSNGTATAGNDYTAMNGTLTFEPGEQVKSISIPIIDDYTLFEEDETLTLILSNPANAALGSPMTTTLTIVDNDVNAPPVDVAAPSDPSQPVTISMFTPAGTVQITLDDVRAGGTITTLVSATSPDQPPSNFTLLGINFDVTTSGISFGLATIRFPYRESDVAAASVPEESLRLLHFENGQWKDITTGLDTTANIITGVTEILSPFVLGVQNMQNCAISLNSGAVYTGRLDVKIFSNMPGAAELLVSNDAGFTGAHWQPYHSALNWTITDPGNRIVTLLVYARLRDINSNLLCSGLSLTDDIIYDPLAPSVNSVVVQSSQAGLLEMQAESSITLLLSAADQQGGSGVTGMLISTHANFTGARWQSYATSAQVIAQPGDDVYVRVRDGVGNISNTVSVTISGQHYIFLPLIVR